MSKGRNDAIKKEKGVLQPLTLSHTAVPPSATSNPTKVTKPRHDLLKRTTQTNQYRRDLKRELKSDAKLMEELEAVIELLVTCQPLPARLRDHRMWGQYRDFRDLHIRPDLILVYMPNKTEITLVRIGSHSELFS